MHEIKCPKCGEVFQVDESGYAELLSQVRNEAFEDELHKRARELEEKNKNDIKMAQMEQEKNYNAALTNKDKVLAEKDMNNKQLAELLGKDPAVVSKWVTNTNQPNVETLIQIAKVLEVSVDELLRTE